MKYQDIRNKEIFLNSASMILEIFILTKLIEACTAKYSAKYVMNYAVKIIENVHEEIHFLLQL